MSEIRLWNVSPEGKLTARKTLTQKGAFGLAFGPRGRTVASGGSDGSIDVWRVSDGELIRRVENPEGAILTLACSPDGDRIAVGLEDGTVRIWDLRWDPAFEQLWIDTGRRLPDRVCRSTLEVVAVDPPPPAESVWAPESACSQAGQQQAR